MTDTTDAEIDARVAALEEARKEFEPLVEKYAPDPFLLGLITAQMVAPAAPAKPPATPSTTWCTGSWSRPTLPTPNPARTDRPEGRRN